MELIYDESKPRIPQYLEMMNKNWQNKYYKWMAEKGKTFLPTEPDKTIEKFHRVAAKLRYDKSKQCYYNSQMMAIILKKEDLKINLKYYEGLYIVQGLEALPLEHAWLVYRGKVFDPTGDNREDVIEYFGMEIDLKTILVSQVKTGSANALLWKVFMEWSKKQESSK